MARKNYYFENKAEQDSVREKVVAGIGEAVDQRKNMSQDDLCRVLDDRDKRFYRAMLIFKAGAHGYHMIVKGYLTFYREQFDKMAQVKDLWDNYVENMNAGILRQHWLKKFPKIKNLEQMVENWIWWAELTMDLQKPGEEHRWTIEALEIASAMVDEGCFEVDDKGVHLIKQPTIAGWEVTAPV